jgi:hypothetical protein
MILYKIVLAASVDKYAQSLEACEIHNHIGKH